MQFQTFGTGATFLTIELGVYELVPVPEPATVLAIAFGTLATGAIIRRRWKKSTVAQSSAGQSERQKAPETPPGLSHTY